MSNIVFKKDINYMKVSKSQAIVFIYEQLLNNEFITKEDIQSVISISDVTFRRYIQELRAYLVNFNKDYEITFDKKQSHYLLNLGK